jgi:hypothetical protein
VTTNKYILCRPNGGFNDTLCQIQKCINYANKYNRILIIDKNRFGQLSNFSKFFIFKNCHKIKIANKKLITSLDLLDCFPPEIQGKINKYKTRLIDHSILFIDGTKTISTFNFNLNYKESLLVHDQFGGGSLSFKLISQIMIKKKWRSIIKNNLPFLGSYYTAIHIRNSDFKTNYKVFLNKIFPELIGKKILLCSEDKTVSRAFRSNREITLLNRSNCKNDPELQSLIDLIALGGASELFYTNLTFGNYSGFSRLAGYLCKNKKVIEHLLNEKLFTKKILMESSVKIIKTPVSYVNLLKNFSRDYLNKSWFIRVLISILRHVHLFYPSRFIYRKFKSYSNP